MPPNCGSCARCTRSVPDQRLSPTPAFLDAGRCISSSDHRELERLDSARPAPAAGAIGCTDASICQDVARLTALLRRLRRVDLLPQMLPAPPTPFASEPLCS